VSRGEALPSIRARIANALLLWAVLGAAAVALAVWLTARHEVDELLDESLQSTGAVLGRALALAVPDNGVVAPPLPVTDDGEFAWQLVGAEGAVLRRSANAPQRAWHGAARTGFSDVPGWRVHGGAAGDGTRMLYVAHTFNERMEAQAEVAASAVISVLAIGLIAHAWLRWRVRRELRPLEELGQRLAAHDPVRDPRGLGAPARAELRSVHEAIEGLGARLARRLTHERAFASHAAHALRTPLAGMDAQLAVALRECAPEQAPRLARVREATTRLQQVVRSLLDLFRAGGEPRRETVRLSALLAHLPVEGVAVEVGESVSVQADPDLLAAALANLLDNARRHGATRVRVLSTTADTLRLHDDGPGIDAERAAVLRDTLAQQDYARLAGLGLMLADTVARAHGGRLSLPVVAAGFAVDLWLPPAGEACG
jgi:signal transduction histidine kinase